MRPRILIVDDCAGTREVIAQMLRADFETVALDNGESAWERMAADTTIVAVITDIDMPGLTGHELLQRTRASTEPRIHKLPIIVITGATDQETRRRIFVGGATGLINKPIDPQQLKALLAVYVHVDPTPQNTATPLAVATSPEGSLEITCDIPASPSPLTIDFASDIDLGEAVEVASEPMLAGNTVVPPTDAVVTAETTAHDPIEELSVDELEKLIEQEAAQQRRNVQRVNPEIEIDNDAPAAPPAELLSIDNALALIRTGNGERLRPYLNHLQQQLLPLLKYCRERGGSDLLA
jgi:CheY-like chemotaxis protein